MPPTEIALNLAKSLVPARPQDGHKGTFGHLYVIAGSRGFTGAPKLVADAAARSGVGLVTVGVPAPLGDIVAAALIEPMSMLLPATKKESIAFEAVDAALSFAKDKQAVALGPGLSQHPDTQRFAVEFVRACPVPMVIDADGLNALCNNLDMLNETQHPSILTPHPGEMARLCGEDTANVQRDRETTASTFAKLHNCIVVLKGHRTVVANPDGEVNVNTTGNAGLATGGTGDVLTGLIGGLLAQGMRALDAATLGVYLHGLAGDLAAKAKTERGMIASDVVDRIPNAWQALGDTT